MIGNLVQRIQIFLGPTGTRVFIAWFVITGLASLILNSIVNQYDWVKPVQTAISLMFIAGVVVIIIVRLPPYERGRWVAILLPSVIAFVLAVAVIPTWSAVLVGGGLGWIVAGTLLGRSRTPIEYRQAIKHLRKSEYDQAAKVMDGVIRAEPQNAQHYRFRAEVYRLWGKMKPAVRDYQKMAELEPKSPLAYNGLAEVYLQSRDYAAARDAAEKANRLAPDDWVTFYNLGMIEDRMQEAAPAAEHLEKALALKVKDSRHRLLIHLYLARAYVRLGQTGQAEQQLLALKKLQTGLEEWQTILKSEQAVTLRAVIGTDVDVAGELMSGALPLAKLGRST